MPYFNSDGMELYYEDIGEGPPLLLLHGLTSSHAMFYREMNFFKKKFRVIALDARGHGKSTKPLKFTLDDHINDAAALIRHLGLQSLSVIGVSMGSYIAQGIAIELPERINKLVLVATKSHGEQSSMEELFNRYKEEFQGLNIVEKLQKSSQFMFHDQEKVNRWLEKTAENGEGLTGREQTIASAALVDFDFRPTLAKLQAETLVISGSHDGLNPPAKGRETAEFIPDAVFMEFKHSGHAPNVEQARLFLGITDNFLD
ncbi:MAG TPA: alpha/beta hydrolase [Planococcus sp. (in: firmicutes)]|nr:alpha/beta hydrolase [Planococcus sp. (in: firmicutes)]